MQHAGHHSHSLFSDPGPLSGEETPDLHEATSPAPQEHHKRLQPAKLQLLWGDLLQAAVREPGLILEAYSHFHGYSLGNRLAALVQCHARDLEPGPLNTYPGWVKLGRQVRGGEKALWLCMPLTRKVKEPGQGADDRRPAGAPEPALNQAQGQPAKRSEVISAFVWKPHWFVLAQTAPALDAEAGQAAAASTEAGAAEAAPASGLPSGWNKAQALRALDITEIPFDHLDGNCQGFAKERSIAVSPLAAMPYKTLFHEMAHVLLGHTQHGACIDDVELSRQVQEAEAESVALLLLATFDLPGQEYCRGYIQSWLHGEGLGEASARRIFGAADKILGAGSQFDRNPVDRSPVDDQVNAGGEVQREVPPQSHEAHSQAQEGRERANLASEAVHYDALPQDALGAASLPARDTPPRDTPPRDTPPMGYPSPDALPSDYPRIDWATMPGDDWNPELAMGAHTPRPLDGSRPVASLYPPPPVPAASLLPTASHLPPNGAPTANDAPTANLEEATFVPSPEEEQGLYRLHARLMHAHAGLQPQLREDRQEMAETIRYLEEKDPTKAELLSRLLKIAAFAANEATELVNEGIDWPTIEALHGEEPGQHEKPGRYSRGRPPPVPAQPAATQPTRFDERITEPAPQPAAPRRLPEHPLQAAPSAPVSHSVPIPAPGPAFSPNPPPSPDTLFPEEPFWDTPNMWLLVGRAEAQEAQERAAAEAQRQSQASSQAQSPTRVHASIQAQAQAPARSGAKEPSAATPTPRGLSSRAEAAARRSLGRELKSELKSERTRFYAIAQRHGLRTDAGAADAMRAALAELFGMPIKSRKELTAKQWSQAASAIETGDLKW